ncbi:MAG: glycosyltransferase, partial [Phycisphaerae bacterium]|nr:glycosyltransferase [Phycisphaerae bacterium]
MTDSVAPSISIVTPSYNQGRFLEEAICSVLAQSYRNVEYVVIDGASTDDSVEVVRKYEDRLAYWVSEPDKGQYDAINKGFARTTGEIMAWLNSDDKYTPWALAVVADIFRTFPHVEWITSIHPIRWNERGQAVHV